MSQLEFYSNAIIGFFVLQGLAFCYNLGSDKEFNKTLKEQVVFSTGLFIVFVLILIFALLANRYICKKLVQLESEMADVVKKVYMGKAFILILFGLLPPILVFVFVLN